MREKILLVQVSEPETSQIKKLADNKGIPVVSVPEDRFGCSLAELINSKAQIDSHRTENNHLPSQSLMVFCDVSEKHFDRLLFEMRNKGISVDYKAVLTETNRNWTLERLYMELIRERIMYT